MATVVQSSTLVRVSSGDSTTVVLNSVTAGNGIALLLATYTGPPPIGLSDTGSASFSQDIQTQNTTDSNGWTLIYRAENVNSGTHTVTVNPGGANAAITVLMCEIGTTLTSATADGTPTGANGNSAAPDTGNITIAAGSLLIGLMSHVDAGTPTMTATYTQLAEEESTALMVANMQSRGDGASLGAGTYTLAWTTSPAVHWMCDVAGWKTAAVTGLPPGLGPDTANMDMATQSAIASMMR